MKKIDFKYFPVNNELPSHLIEVVDVFKVHANEIDSDRKRKKALNSNDVLKIVSDGLSECGYRCEKSKSKNDRIQLRINDSSQRFDVDGYNEEQKAIIEVEAGRAFRNHQFLKDLFEAFVMEDVEFLTIVVRRSYSSKSTTKDFELVSQFIETMYASKRFIIPLKGILIIGY